MTRAARIQQWEGAVMPDGEDVLEFYHNIISQAQNILIGPIEADFMAWGGGNLVRCIATLAAALWTSRERVAELEPNAALGRAIRDWPVHAGLKRGLPSIEWIAYWPVKIDEDGVGIRRGSGDTPEDALEVAKRVTAC